MDYPMVYVQMEPAPLEWKTWKHYLSAAGQSVTRRHSGIYVPTDLHAFHWLISRFINLFWVEEVIFLTWLKDKFIGVSDSIIGFVLFDE